MPPRPPASPSTQPRDIRDMLMYRIARLATLGDRTGQSRISRQFGLNVSEWRIFGTICALQPVTLAELARELYLDKGQLSRTASLLIENGLVSPRPSVRDRRQTLYEPTAKGLRLHDRVLAFVTVRNEDLMSGLNEREQAQLFRLLDKLTVTFARSFDELFGPMGDLAETREQQSKRARAGPAERRSGDETAVRPRIDKRPRARAVAS